MVIYEVNVNVENDIYSEYYNWLVKHIKQMLQFTGFKKAEIGLIEHQHTSEKRLRISYLVNSYTDLENYLNNHAEVMRAKGIEKFGAKFSATRRIITDSVMFESHEL